MRVEDGVLTLTGQVDTWYERFEASSVARQVAGIHEIHNELVVGTAPVSRSVPAGVRPPRAPAGERSCTVPVHQWS